MIFLALLIGGSALAFYSQSRCTKLDVATGRRDAMAIDDDYGSNRGWHWPWSLLAILGFLIALSSPILGLIFT